MRVYELAKEFGVESKAVLAKLSALGEFVRSASSVVPAPVERRLREVMDQPAPNHDGFEVVAPAVTRTRSSRIAYEHKRRAPRHELTLEQEAEIRKRQSQRGKRYKGSIDPATQQSLAWNDAQIPPFIDEYEQAFAETRRWTDLGWIAHEEIARWRDECPGISAECGMAFQAAGVSPRSARKRWNGRALDDDGEFMLYQAFSSYGPARTQWISVENACWLLRQAGLLAG